jgi:hypothetical protein
MTTFFGFTTGAEDLNTGAELDWVAAGYSCPGSGNQSITTIGVYTQVTGYSVRVGIFSGTTLIVETSTKSTVASGEVTWGSGDLTWSSGSYLTGGDTYKLVLACSGNPGVLGTSGAASGTSKYYVGDYSAGMPATLPAGTDYTWYGFNIRCGVDDVVSATIEQEGFRARKDDGSESAATFLLEAQDADFKAPLDTNLRIRFLVNTIGDVATTPFQLEYRKSGDTPWNKVLVP